MSQQSQAGAEERSLESCWSALHARRPKKLGAFSIIIIYYYFACLILVGAGHMSYGMLVKIREQLRGVSFLHLPLQGVPGIELGSLGSHGVLVWVIIAMMNHHD